MERVRTKSGRLACAWTEEDLQFIRENYEEGYDKLADHFRVTYQTMRTKCLEMGLKRTDPHRGRKRQFTEEEDDYLREHYPNEPITDICDKTGISYANVKKRVAELGIRKSEGYSPSNYNHRYVRHYSGYHGVYSREK